MKLLCGVQVKIMLCCLLVPKVIIEQFIYLEKANYANYIKDLFIVSCLRVVYFDFFESWENKQ